MIGKKRVVITGMGAISPLGIGVKETWQSAIEGKSGIDRISQFDASSFPVQIAGEVKGFDPSKYIEAKEIKKMDRFIHFAVASSIMAVEDSGLKITDENSERVGVIIGSGIGGLPAIEYYHNIFLEKGYKRISPFFIPMLIVNLASGNVSIRLGARGPSLSIVTACASGNHSIGEAFRFIQRGEADVMISGGTESCITPLGVGGFAAMKALSTRNYEPKKASRPFDLNRDGFVIAEGAGVLVLENIEIAKARGAKIYGEIIGFGSGSDAYHITSPSPGGEGGVRCMKSALMDAGIKSNDISYINAHGTSTKQGDEVETMAIKKVFGDHAYKLCISSTKSMTGHLLGAAGGIESIFSILSIFNDIVLPTINYENRDSECDLDYVPNKCRKTKVEYVLSNSFGFGGTNASLIFKKYRAD